MGILKRRRESRQLRNETIAEQKRERIEFDDRQRRIALANEGLRKLDVLSGFTAPLARNLLQGMRALPEGMHEDLVRNVFNIVLVTALSDHSETELEGFGMRMQSGTGTEYPCIAVSSREAQAYKIVNDAMLGLVLDNAQEVAP